MNKRELLNLAKRYFIADDGRSVTNLIRKIQVAEGGFECFATGKRSWGQMRCQWRAECLSESAEDVQIDY